MSYPETSPERHKELEAIRQESQDVTATDAGWRTTRA